MTAPAISPSAHTPVEAYRFGGYAPDSADAHCDACGEILAGTLWTVGATVSQVEYELRRRFRALGELQPEAGGLFAPLASLAGAPSLHGGYFGLYRAEDARRFAVAVLPSA